MSARANASVAHNRTVHDGLGARYDGNHPEIYNDIEQRRLAQAVDRAASAAPRRGARRVRALDVGCGTGNLTGHLIRAGATVKGLVSVFAHFFTRTRWDRMFHVIH